MPRLVLHECAWVDEGPMVAVRLDMNGIANEA